MPGARRILIIGSGFGGLGLAIRLKRAGIHDFTILERKARVGGTWRDNAYPGAACDVLSMLYCFSFEQKRDWSRKWSPQAEIQAYIEDVVRRNDLAPHIRFGVEVAGARFDEATGTWAVRTTAGEELVADVVVAAVGQLHRPSIPAIPGRADFRGVAFHSARWNHDCDLRGKRVAVVGNAASAIQLIPQVAAEAAHLTVFQRSANWMIPRGDRPYTDAELWAFRHVPGLARAYRWWLWWLNELLLYPVMRRNRFLSRLYAKKSRDYMHEVVADPALRRKLEPDYPIGGKRILIADDFYPALVRPNVAVVDEPIARIVPDGLVTADGRTHAVDVIVFATGFRTNPFLASMDVEGVGGRRLADDWAEGARAYYGLTVPGFPNFFMLYGPNTNLGHNSIIFMLECQIAYIMDAIQWIRRDDLKSIELDAAVMAAFNERVQRDLASSAWAAAGDSWYKDAGRVTNNWPYSTFEYWRRTRAMVHAEYRAERRGFGKLLPIPARSAA